MTEDFFGCHRGAGRAPQIRIHTFWIGDLTGQGLAWVSSSYCFDIGIEAILSLKALCRKRQCQKKNNTLTWFWVYCLVKSLSYTLSLYFGCVHAQILVYSLIFIHTVPYISPGCHFEFVWCLLLFSYLNWSTEEFQNNIISHVCGIHLWNTAAFKGWCIPQLFHESRPMYYTINSASGAQRPSKADLECSGLQIPRLWNTSA